MISTINTVSFQVRDDALIPCDFKDRLKRFFSPETDKQEIQALATHILNNISDPDKTDAYIRLADAFVSQYATTSNGDKITKIFDRDVAKYRPEAYFLHKDNKVALEKWKKYSQDASIYQNHPDFCSFMEKSGLLSQIKVTHDTFQEIDGEAAIKVDGHFMKWSNFQKQFKIEFSQRYKETFIINNNNQVYTYLDNGKGLQLHHPFLSEQTPISILNEEEYLRVLEKAHTFIRTNEADLSNQERGDVNSKRTFVLQLVTSRIKGNDSRFADLISNPKHPYLRLIIGKDNPNTGTSKGEVYEVGFGWKEKVVIPLITTQGRFRSPDIWEYSNCEERVVTNIPVTQEEAQSFVSYVSDYHRGEVNLGAPVGFHFFRQNCSTFARAALKAANIDVPTTTTLADLVPRVTPLWLFQITNFVNSIASKASNLGKRSIQILPEGIKNPLATTARKIKSFIKNTLDTLTAVIFIPFKIALGEAFGKGGREFVIPGDKPKQMEFGLRNFKQWFSFSRIIINLPGILQLWQKEQASTVIYKNPIKLAIVP